MEDPTVTKPQLHSTKIWASSTLNSVFNLRKIKRESSVFQLDGGKTRALGILNLFRYVFGKSLKQPGWRLKNSNGNKRDLSEGLFAYSHLIQKPKCVVALLLYFLLHDFSHHFTKSFIYRSEGTDLFWKKKFFSDRSSHMCFALEPDFCSHSE